MIHPDIDNLIFEQISEPPTVLALSEVNTYFLHKISSKRNQINEIRYNLNYACQKGYLWIAQWLLICSNTCQQRTISRMLGDLRIITPNDLWMAFRIAVQHGQLAIVKWIIDMNLEIDCMDEFTVIMHGCVCMSCKTDLSLDITKCLFDMADQYNLNIDIHNFDDYIFRRACSQGQINTAKYLISMENKYGMIDIHAVAEDAFISACANGHLDVAQWLVELGQKSHGNIDASAKDDRAFRFCCRDGHIDIAQWLWTSHFINIHAQNDYAYRKAVKYNYQSIIQMLDELDPALKSIYGMRYAAHNIYDDCNDLRKEGYDVFMKNLFESGNIDLIALAVSILFLLAVFIVTTIGLQYY